MTRTTLPLTLPGVALFFLAGISSAGNAPAPSPQAGNTPASTVFAQSSVATVSNVRKSNSANAAGWNLFKARKYPEAIIQFSGATELNTANKLAWNNLGCCHMRLYETGLSGTAALGSAASAFTSANELEPAFKTDPYWKSENLKQALAAIEQEKKWTEAAQGRTGQTPAECTGYWPCREAGDKAETEGDFASAKAAYGKAEAAAPSKRGRAVCANMLGLLALRQRDPQTAVNELRRAAGFDPSYKLAWNNLGNALILLYYSGTGGKELVEEAVAAFRKMGEIDPSYKPENLATAEKLLTELGGPTVTPVSATIVAEPAAPASPSSPAATSPGKGPASPAPAKTVGPAKPTAPAAAAPAAPAVARPASPAVPASPAKK